jgi:pimeloyl-ACP methyl ester carboxylesterase
MQQLFEIASSRGVGAAGTKPMVIALHCSGSSGRQWNKLASALGDRCTLIAPDHIGCGATRPWSGDHRFCLADEAARILDIVDAQDGPIHLVGHSYGGGVALRVARERPERIASLSLYEPTAFHVLRSKDPDGRTDGTGADPFSCQRCFARRDCRRLPGGRASLRRLLERRRDLERNDAGIPDRACQIYPESSARIQRLGRGAGAARRLSSNDVPCLADAGRIGARADRADRAKAVLDHVRCGDRGNLQRRPYGSVQPCRTRERHNRGSRASCGQP